MGSFVHRQLLVHCFTHSRVFFYDTVDLLIGSQPFHKMKLMLYFFFDIPCCQTKKPNLLSNSNEFDFFGFWFLFFFVDKEKLMVQFRNVQWISSITKSSFLCSSHIIDCTLSVTRAAVFAAWLCLWRAQPIHCLSCCFSISFSLVRICHTAIN